MRSKEVNIPNQSTDLTGRLKEREGTVHPQSWGQEGSVVQKERHRTSDLVSLRINKYITQKKKKTSQRDYRYIGPKPWEGLMPSSSTSKKLEKLQGKEGI